MTLRIAVAGNPNAGKSTLFNALSGARARVGNYPGITVERREAPVRLLDGTWAQLIDLPGCYSLVARSAEEDVAHRVLMGELGQGAPDRVVCVVDATQLARGLYLALQLLELGLPCVVALNMMDVAAARGISIDAAKLSVELGVPVVPLTARSGVGLTALRQALGQRCAACPTALTLDLTQGEQAAIDRVAAAWQALQATGTLPGNPRGHGLWLITSRCSTLAQPLPPALQTAVHDSRGDLDPAEAGAFNRRVIAARYAAIDRILARCQQVGTARAETVSQRIDRIVLNPLLGPVLLVAAMLGLFQAVFAWAAPLVAAVGAGMGLLADTAGQWLPEGYFRELVVHGILAGINSVLSFVPQIALLFFGLAILEESGYLARAAFLLDRLMRRVGLQGKAFVPLMSSFGCAVPGIMAARTLECSRDRLVTILVAPFMSCSARLPVYTLVVGAAFAGAPPLWGAVSVGALVVLAMYGLGFVAAVGTAAVLKRSVLKSAPTAMLMELPAYRMPELRAVVRQVAERARLFVQGTGRTIVALSMLLWALLTFPQVGLPAAELAARQAQVAALCAAEQPQAQVQLDRDARAYALQHSAAGTLGRTLEPAIAPLGFDWRIGVGLIASFAAREVLVSTLAQIYALDPDTEAGSTSLHDAMRADIDPATGASRFTPLVGLSLMVFYVLALQCLSTVATVRRETGSWRWAVAQLSYMNALAYVASLAVYQSGRALGYT
jgi:ferrous iron transport protein B